jgi:peptide-methionine (R)-S-oxide reductase
MKRTLLYFVTLLVATAGITSCAAQNKKQPSKTMNTTTQHNNNPYYSRTDTTHLNVSNDEWKKILSKEVYNIAREKGTEWAFSGQYYKTDVKGMYYCAVCGNPLFRSTSKFASSCGWPSFFESLPGAARYEEDNTHGMHRVEVLCGRCDSHLGHIFDDGPEPTGKRYCMNSAVLDFEPDDANAE